MQQKRRKENTKQEIGKGATLYALIFTATPV